VWCLDVVSLNCPRTDISPKYDKLNNGRIVGPNFIIKDLLSVFILLIEGQISNDSLCCSIKYN